MTSEMCVKEWRDLELLSELSFFGARVDSNAIWRKWEYQKWNSYVEKMSSVGDAVMHLLEDVQ